MRSIIAITMILGCAACTSDEFSKVPDPTGEWAALNPPGFVTAEAAPLPVPDDHSPYIVLNPPKSRGRR